MQRPDFDRWYRASADHAEAYERIAATFEAAGALRHAEIGRARGPGRARRSPTTGWRLAWAGLFFCTAACLLALVAGRSGELRGQGEIQAAMLEAGAQSRSLVLADGSRVILAPGAGLRVAIGASERRLRLVRGQGRFSVAHERRPFVVEAGGAEVVAHGTEFVVDLTSDSATVSLIQGSIDLFYPRRDADRDRRRVARLRPGQRVIMNLRRAETLPVGQSLASRQDPRSTGQMLAFEDMPLSDAIDRVNGTGGPRIVFADPAIGGLRVTGSFRRGDNAAFARSLAVAFALEVRAAPDKSLLLVPRQDFLTTRRKNGG